MRVHHDPGGDTSPCLFGEQTSRSTHYDHFRAHALGRLDDGLGRIVTFYEFDVAFDALGSESSADRIDRPPATFFEVERGLFFSGIALVRCVVEKGPSDVVIERLEKRPWYTDDRHDRNPPFITDKTLAEFGYRPARQHTGCGNENPHARNIRVPHLTVSRRFVELGDWRIVFS